MALPIEVDSENAIARMPEWMELAQRLALTTYDAAYVELARRRSWPLATLDVKLRAACGIAGGRCSVMYDGSDGRATVTTDFRIF